MWLSITGDLCGLALGERGRSERSCLRPENVLSVSFHLLDPRTCGPGTQSRPGSTYLRVYAASYPDGAQVLLGPLGRSPAFYFIACFIPNHHIGLTQTLQTAQLVCCRVECCMFVYTIKSSPGLFQESLFIPILIHTHILLAVKLTKVSLLSWLL